jgi:hypothetical protein
MPKMESTYGFDRGMGSIAEIRISESRETSVEMPILPV